jgi:hypothetical protein
MIIVAEAVTAARAWLSFTGAPLLSRELGGIVAGAPTVMGSAGDARQ